MNETTLIIAGMVTNLIAEIVVIVGALAVLVGIGILVAFGFRRLRGVGSDRDYAQEAWDKFEDEQDVW